MTKAQQDWIDNASYEELLRRWRFAPSGDPYFQGDTGQYYQAAMARRRAEVGSAEHVLASKTVGWEPR